MASNDRELKMTLHLLHFCTHGGKKVKEMVEEVAEVADAGVVNDADLSDRIETLERQFRVFHALFDNFFLIIEFFRLETPYVSLSAKQMISFAMPRTELMITIQWRHW